MAMKLSNKSQDTCSLEGYIMMLLPQLAWVRGSADEQSKGLRIPITTPANGTFLLQSRREKERERPMISWSISAESKTENKKRVTLGVAIKVDEGRELRRDAVHVVVKD